MDKLNFNKEFIFGSATAAYQIEGAWDQEGRGLSIWDTFTHKKGKIRSNDNGDTACDHYNRYKDDVTLMRGLDLQAYRFSISWSRVIPDGIGPVNPKGLDFYSRLVDELLASDIEPFITLYHWDMPQALYDKFGGFRSRECAHHFADYTEVILNALGDRAKNWITVNEPWEHAAMGHLLGEHAPGNKKPWLFLKVIHNQLLAHGYEL
jgi:beta-glucosidase